MQVIRQAIKKESRPTDTAFGIDNIIITRESCQYFPRGSISKKWSTDDNLSAYQNKRTDI